MTLTVRSATVSGATTKGSALTHAELDENFNHLSQASNISVTQSGSGASSRTAQAKMREIPSVQDFGASTSATAAGNTTAFNAALAAHSVVFVPGSPGDVYDLNALSTITASKILYGNGATLRFNTTSDCILLQPASSLQANKVRIVGLKFDNVTNTPSSFIKNDGFLNTALEDLHFSDCAATYCVDNVKGYGTTLSRCVFSDVTGVAVRLRDDGASAEYSYAFKMNDCDITRPSGNGIECEGTGVLLISGGVIEECGGKGLVTATAGAASIQGWNVTLVGTYLEDNTGTDIDLSTDGADYWSHANVIGCSFVGTSTIALGSKSKVAIIGCHNTGANAVTVSGSANAEAFLANSYNFTQSGTFTWFNASAGAFPGAAGTAGAPSFTFRDALTSGFFNPSSSIVAYSSAGFERSMFSGSTFVMRSDGSIGFSNGTTPSSGTLDTILARDAANTLAHRNGTSAQTVNNYGTFTSTSSYQRSGWKQAKATLSAVSGASVTATNLIPDGAFLLGVTTRINTGLGATNGTTGYAVGTAADPNLWGDVAAITAGTASGSTSFTATGASGLYIAAESVIITAATGNFDGTGEIEVIAHYFICEAD
jgi:hypothetical protein